MSIQVIIDQNEIETAIRNHVASKISFAEGQNVTIDLKAGRGENGFSATIVIGGEDAPAQPATTAAGPTVRGPFKRDPKPSADAPTSPTGETAIPPQDGLPKEEAVADTGAQTPAEDAAPADAEPAAETEAKPKTGLFQHLPKRTGTDTEAK